MAVNVNFKLTNEKIASVMLIFKCILIGEKSALMFPLAVLYSRGFIKLFHFEFLKGGMHVNLIFP